MLIIILFQIVIIVTVHGKSHTNKQILQMHREGLRGMIGELKMEQTQANINITYGRKKLMIFHYIMEYVQEELQWQVVDTILPMV